MRKLEPTFLERELLGKLTYMYSVELLLLFFFGFCQSASLGSQQNRKISSASSKYLSHTCFRLRRKSASLTPVLFLNPIFQNRKISSASFPKTQNFRPPPAAEKSYFCTLKPKFSRLRRVLVMVKTQSMRFILKKSAPSALRTLNVGLLLV